jgi:hypothetical protein
MAMDLSPAVEFAERTEREGRFPVESSWDNQIDAFRSLLAAAERMRERGLDHIVIRGGRKMTRMTVLHHIVTMEQEFDKEDDNG